MHYVQASDAKARLLQLLTQVESGETIVITRHGRAIARLTPERDQRRQMIDAAIDGIKALRARLGQVGAEELLAARHEGHEY
jgi:prevent-host-death family protein